MTDDFKYNIIQYYRDMKEIGYQLAIEEIAEYAVILLKKELSEATKNKE